MQIFWELPLPGLVDWVSSSIGRTFCCCKPLRFHFFLFQFVIQIVWIDVCWQFYTVTLGSPWLLPSKLLHNCHNELSYVKHQYALEDAFQACILAQTLTLSFCIHQTMNNFAGILIPFNMASLCSMMWWVVWLYFWGKLLLKMSPQTWQSLLPWSCCNLALQMDSSIQNLMDVPAGGACFLMSGIFLYWWVRETHRHREPVSYSVLSLQHLSGDAQKLDDVQYIHSTLHLPWYSLLCACRYSPNNMVSKWSLVWCHAWQTFPCTAFHNFLE